jgi:hypothetical protein
MNPKLRNLLVMVGVVGAASIAVFAPRPGVKRGDLVDAGIAGCLDVDVSCVFRWDGGYRRRIFPGRFCGTTQDGGLVVPLREDALAALFNYATCKRVGTGCNTCAGGAADDKNPGQLQADTEECRCRRDGGVCNLPDGGPAPYAVQLDSSIGSGAGCVEAPCNELAGYSSLPPECR